MSGLLGLNLDILLAQGGLDRELREISIRELTARNTPGYAIGGLAGGEDKNEFWRCVSPVCHSTCTNACTGVEQKWLTQLMDMVTCRVVAQCTAPGSGLPEDRPRYVMGIGYPLDILVCSGEWHFAGVTMTWCAA